MPSHCCPECFGDRGLKKSIIPLISTSVGKCDFCDSTEQNLVEPKALAEWFKLLISIYEPDANGKLLVEWMKEDWQLFSHDKMDIAHAKELLGEVLDDGDIVRRNFSPSEKYKSEVLVRWETLRDELMYKNRYFLDEPLDTDRLKELLGHLPADDLPDLWYRARIRNGEVNYEIKDMGPPPNRLASHGRANPPGIPYLYVGSQPDTAASEIRPHTGEVACVAEFSIKQPLRAVDLRNPRKLVSPFLLGDAGAIGQLRADIQFLERLGDELTRPVLPQGAAIDYVPSQYLCEFIKKSGYDGVIYRSSVSDGMNLALFNPAKATGGTVSLYKILRVFVDVKKDI